MAIEWAARGKVSVLGIASGAVAGLVAVTPAAGYVGVGPALVIGVAASLACFGAVVGLKSWFGYDDSLDAFGIHAVGGIIGSILTGVFASAAIGGVEGSITAQLIGIGACAAYALGRQPHPVDAHFRSPSGLRVSEEAERPASTSAPTARAWSSP
jgi:Amt family ammonium transporter